ncbi:MAG: alpha-1,2-fucosyltransferase [bacterium]
MTICSITSGLGNQLFQYSAGLHWVKVHGGELTLDTSWYNCQKHQPKRAFRLGAFHIPESKVGGAVSLGLMGARFLAKKMPNLLESVLYKAFWTDIVTETDVHNPDPRFEDGRRDDRAIWLNGYWQTADHFLAVREILSENLKPAIELSSGYRHWLQEITRSASVFIHVRRGDYVDIGHGMLTPAYYAAAVEQFPHGSRWFIFSEDLKWCRARLNFPGAVSFVDYVSPNRDIEDLLLMAACGGAIIANSSFSWWGAALGESDDRLVVAPNFRHGPGEGDVQMHRLLPRWKTINTF